MPLYAFCSKLASQTKLGGSKEPTVYYFKLPDGKTIEATFVDKTKKKFLLTWKTCILYYS